jgi:tRNA dimethylallyltransferase
MQKPVVVMGPTASGKTELAIALSKASGGEIISADSRQIYTKLAAGTAKPPGEWKTDGTLRAYFTEGIPCHLVDFLDPRASYDAGSFVSSAGAALEAIHSRGKLPVFAGGTGFYLQAFWNGLDALPSGDAELRKELARMAQEIGTQAMHEKLRAFDPEAAEKIPPGNIQRIIRAIEVHELTGIPISRLWTRQFYGTLPVHKAIFIVLDWSRDILRERIAERTHNIFDAMAAETDALLKSGYPEDCPGLKSLGYPQVLDYLHSRMDRTETIHRITTVTRAYAKRQVTWLRRYRNAEWITLENMSDWKPQELVKTILDSHQTSNA